MINAEEVIIYVTRRTGFLCRFFQLNTFFVWSVIALCIKSTFLRIFMHYILISQAVYPVSIHKYFADTVITDLVFSEP